LPLITFGQGLSLIDSAQLGGIESVSIDRQGSFYIATTKGSLKKYSKDNKLVAEFSPQKKGAITLIEAWNPLRPFVFYESFQEYLFLDRFLTNSNRFDVKSITDYAGLVTVSADNNLWVVDLADFGLKKYNISFGQFTIETSFDLLLNPDNYNITHIREYQSRVFVSDEQSGILVFDNLGNYLNSIEVKGVKYFGLAENEIYFLQKSQVVFYDIYSRKKRAITLPVPAEYALIDGDLLRTFLKNEIRVYKITK